MRYKHAVDDALLIMSGVSEKATASSDFTRGQERRHLLESEPRSPVCVRQKHRSVFYHSEILDEPR